MTGVQTCALPICTSVSIEPDLAVGYLLSILGHIHGNGNMGTPTTPPIPGT